MLAGIFIVLTSYTSKRHLCVLFLVLGIGFSGLNAIGYAVHHLDIAPRYAGVLMGLSNTFASTPGFISPQITGFVTKNKVSNRRHPRSNCHAKRQLKRLWVGGFWSFTFPVAVWQYS